jgi:serine/threonine protein kinase
MGCLGSKQSLTESATAFEAAYKQTRLLGRGSFGDVVEAESLKTKKRYAVKKMKITDKNRSMVDFEIVTLQKLARVPGQPRPHPNIVNLIEVCKSDTQWCVVLELCPGGDLHQKVQQEGALSERESLNVLRQVLDAVVHMHALGYCHRDLKPGNLILARREAPLLVKVTDFGLTTDKAGPSDADKGYANVMATATGTHEYTAPEVFLLGDEAGSESDDEGVTSSHQIDEKYSAKVDIWSVGAIAYTILGGKHPFDFESVSRPVILVKVGNHALPLAFCLSLNYSINFVIQTPTLKGQAYSRTLLCALVVCGLTSRAIIRYR